MHGFEHLPRDAFQRLTRELSGEKILWAGRPSPRAAFWKGIPIWLFAIPWTVFSLAWEGIALAAFFAGGEQAPAGAGAVMVYVFPIFGLPFVLIGLGMMGAPFWQARKARRSVHILTDKRLVTAELGNAMSIESIEPARIVALTRKEERDGSGTLTLSLGKFRDSDGDAVEKLVTWPGVPEVKVLEDRLREGMAESRRG